MESCSPGAMSKSHLASATSQEQEQFVISILRETPWMADALDALRKTDLPDGWIVAGAIYNLVWNRLTDRPPQSGIKDIDVFYFDSSDLSWEAEDEIIKRNEQLFEKLPFPAEIRNQARVHRWFPKHFGFEIAPIKSSRDSIARFSSVAYCIGARLDEQNEIELDAPHGLADLLEMRIRPNRAYNNNREAHEKKAGRAKLEWPEVTVEAW